MVDRRGRRLRARACIRLGVSTSPSAVAAPAALRACWHPVAYARERRRRAGRGRPARGARSCCGATRAARRTRSPTSASTAAPRSRSGRVEGDEIVCPYHGWRYGADGALHRDPAARRPDARARQGARRRRSRCQERYGLRLGRARGAALAAARGARARRRAAGQSCRAGPYAWHCDASRQVENFTDFGHFPWVHPGLLGDPARPVVPDHTVRDRGPRPALRDRPPGGAQHRRLPGVRATRTREAPERRSRYELHLPYTIVLRLGWGGERGHGLLLRLAAGRAGPLRRLRR